eukprot:gene38600-46925_t
MEGDQGQLGKLTSLQPLGGKLTLKFLTLRAQDEASTRRARRSTRYSGDFQLSFGDASTDDEEREIAEEKKRRASLTKASARKKECPGCGSQLPVSARECKSCDYQFTSKSMLVNQQSAIQESLSIRDKFPFEPERDDDGSLLIDRILGRRIIKTGKRWTKSSANSVSVADMTAAEAKYEYEYLIKYKNMSFLHVQWLTANDIEGMSQKSKAALNRYLTRLDKGDETANDDPEIDPSFTEIEKILDCREEEVQEVVDDATVPHNQAALKDLEKMKKAVEKGEVTDNGADQQRASAVDYNNIEVGRSLFATFNPTERAKWILEKIWEDPYSVSFQEPVDTSVYEDYLDVVEESICLQDIKNKIAN